MTEGRDPGRSGSAPIGTAALALAWPAIAFALIALPGALVWLTFWIPALGVPDAGVLLILANVVTIPAALLSWLLACASATVGLIALLRRHRDRRVALALMLGTPGAVLGTVLIVAVAVQLGGMFGVLPSADDLRRQHDARAVAAHLALPLTGPRSIAHCEDREGVTLQQRTVSVVETWSEARLERIRGRLGDYSSTQLSAPVPPTEQEQLYFTGHDASGNYVTVFVDRFPAGTRLELGCRTVALRGAAMRTVVVLSD